MNNKYYFILAIILSRPAFGQEMLLLPPGISTLSTRDANEYLTREQALISWIEHKESQQNTLLAEDFEIWSVESKQWLSKAKWLEALTQQTTFNISNLSVRHMDDLVIVSFLLESHANVQGEQSTQFIVDVWKKSTNQLKIRYTSDVTAQSSIETKY